MRNARAKGEYFLLPSGNFFFVCLPREVVFICLLWFTSIPSQLSSHPFVYTCILSLQQHRLTALYQSLETNYPLCLILKMDKYYRHIPQIQNLYTLRKVHSCSSTYSSKEEIKSWFPLIIRLPKCHVILGSFTSCFKEKPFILSLFLPCKPGRRSFQVLLKTQEYFSLLKILFIRRMTNHH